MLSPEFILWKDGELEADGTNSTDYVGGQILKIDSSTGRLSVAKNDSTDTLVGWAANDREVDISNGSVTYYAPLVKAQLFGSTESDGTVVYPWDSSKSYTVGEKLYINETTGKLTNVSGDSTSGVVMAIIVGVGTSYIGVSGNYLRIIGKSF